MAAYTLVCSGTVCGGVNVLGVLELDDAMPPAQVAAAAWGHLCAQCAAAWAAAIANDAADATKHGRPTLPPQAVAPIGPPRLPPNHPGPP